MTKKKQMRQRDGYQKSKRSDAPVQARLGIEPGSTAPAFRRKNDARVEAQQRFFNQRAPLNSADQILRLIEAGTVTQARILGQLQREQGNHYVQALLSQGHDATIQRCDGDTEQQARCWFERAKAYYRQGDWHTAIILFERVRQMPGVDESVRVTCLYNIGVVNVRTERYATAVYYLEEYIASPDTTPSDQADAQSWLDQARDRSGMPGEETASPDLEQVRAMFEEAMQFYEAGQWRRAIIRFERIRHLPGVSEEVRASCLYNIGQTNRRLGRNATAIPYLEEYIIMPNISEDDRAEARIRLEEARRRAGIPVQDEEVTQEEARAIFEHAEQLYDDEEWDRAIAQFERLWQMPGLSDTVRATCPYNIGMCHLRLGNAETAIPYFNTYINNPIVSESDRAAAQEKLNEARHQAGVRVEEEIVEE